MTLTHRLDRLHRHYPPRPARTPALDVSALTSEECFALDAILAKLEGGPTHPNGRTDLSPLLDAELERAYELSEKGRAA
jgi:hypothetical protein